MCCCGRHGWWRGSVLNNNDLAESAVTVDLLDLAVANGVLMSALAFPGRHGWSGHCAWTRVCGIQLVVVLIMVAKDLGGGQVVVNRLHCLCESERRGGKRSRGKLGQVFGRGQLNGGHHCKPLPNCLLFFFVYFLPLLLSLSSSSPPIHGSPSGTLYIPGIYLHHRSFLPYSQPEPVLQLHSKYRIIALQRHPAATIHTAIPHETLRVRFISIVKALLHWAALANVMNIKKPCVLRLSLAHKMTNIRRCFVLIVRGILRGMV